MVYRAIELLGQLKHLTLVGVDPEGYLEFIGTGDQWLAAENYEQNEQNNRVPF